MGAGNVEATETSNPPTTPLPPGRGSRRDRRPTQEKRMTEQTSREREPSAFAAIFGGVLGALAIGATVWAAVGGTRDRDTVTARRLPGAGRRRGTGA